MSAVATKKTTKPKAVPTHPPVAEMVKESITVLKDRKGSSLAAIKKYMAGHYKVDTDRLAPFIRRYLKSAVAAGTLVQTKGTGASGSFKLGKVEKPKPKKVEKPKKMIKTDKKPKKTIKTDKKPKKTTTKADKVKKAAKKTDKPKSKTAKPKTKTAAKKTPKPKKTPKKSKGTPKKAAKPKAVKKLVMKKTPKKAANKTTKKAAK